MDVLNFGRALYYPHIFPQSRLWLRTAALYHDGIGRIVPQGFVASAYDRHSGPRLLEDFEALQESGFIEDEHPNHVLQEVGQHFLDFIAPNLENTKRKSRLVSKLNSGTWKPYNMFREKIAPGLFELLESEGLARNVSDYEVEFDGSVGGLYMLFLARHMAKQRPIVSDDPTYEALTHAPFQAASPADPTSDAGFLLATAVFRSAVPLDIESIDIRELIKFRGDFAGERVAFYDCISKLGSDIAKIQDQKQLSQAIAHHAAAIRNRISLLQKKLSLLKLTCGKGVFSFSMPGWVPATAWGLGVTNPAVLIGTGALVLAGVIVGSQLEQRIAKGDAPFAYIHSVRDKLTPRDYANRLIQLNLTGWN